MIRRPLPLLLFACLAPLAAASPPHIVFILADDLGYGELGAYGQQKIQTPHLDQLAAQGLRFTRHYTGAPVCAPARCTLLTGRHLGHAQIRDNGDSGAGGPFPGQAPLAADTPTLTRALHHAGYATGGFGKWGLGPTSSPGSPLAQGFDRFYGYNCQRNAHSFYPPFLDDDATVERLNDPAVPGHVRQPEGPVLAETYRAQTYAPDRIREEALSFLHRQLEQEPGKPLFLYLPFIEPHVAMHPPQQWVDLYPEEWDAEKGAYRGQNGYLPHPRPRAGYAAMISHLDDHVGTVLAALEEAGIADQSLIIFTSDNGTTHPGRDPAFHIGGVDAPFFNSSGGLRGWKGSVLEGGIRVPAIVRWPGVTAPGTTTDFPSYFPDWFPTLCSVAGAPAPDETDGVDLSPLLRGEAQPPREKPMIWEFHGYGGQLAVIDGPWKALRVDVKKAKPQPWQLFHLDDDPAEEQDLASSHPEILERLVAAFLTDRSPNPAFPLPLYDPAP